MAVDNPSYFTIPGGLSPTSTAVIKSAKFSLLKRHIRMGSSASAQPLPVSPGSSWSQASTGQYNTLPSLRSETRHREERYSTPPSTSTNQRTARSLMFSSPVHTEMLVLGMPRPSDVAPSNQRHHNLRHNSVGQPYKSNSDLSTSYYNLGGTPPSRRHSIGAYFVRKPSMTGLTKDRPGIEEEVIVSQDQAEGTVKKHCGTIKRRNRIAGMEDIIIISSQKSQAAELWVTYLKTCFEQIRKNRKKPPFKILCINIEDVEDSTAMTPVVESKLRQARLEIVIVCPVFLDYVLQYPERMCKVASLLQPLNVLAMLLGVEEKSITEKHREALISFGEWKKMESVKDRDEKFVSDFLGAAMEILGKTPTALPESSDKCHFMLVPKKVNQGQKKVVVILNEPIEKDDVMRVSILRNGEEAEVPGVKKCNPFTLAFRVPEVYLGATALVTVRVTHNRRDLGGKQLKCESQLHALEQLLRNCDNPIEFTCQALNIVPTDKGKLDDMLVKAFQRNVPANFNILQSAGFGQIHRGSACKEEFPTLLHFAAHYGLEQLSWALVECAGGEAACDTRNAKEMTPAEMADAAGHVRLSNLLSGYMQMNQFSSAYAFLKGMVDVKSNGTEPSPVDEYLNPRPLHETYQIPPSPRPCPPPETPPPPLGYMPMRSPMGRLSQKSESSSSDRNSDGLGLSKERLFYRSNSEEHSESRKREPRGNGIEEELIEIINDFKNNVLTISEVESLVEQWRRRNDVQQSFREKQEHLAKLREEYERVQLRMKDGMKDVGRSSPMERLRNFFRGKPKESKPAKTKTDKKRRKQEEVAGNRPSSSLSIISSSSGSSSGRLSTASGGSLCDSSINSEADSERKLLRNQILASDSLLMDNYDIPPSPILVTTERSGRNLISNYDVPPSPVELAAACFGVEYYNLPPLPNESSLSNKVNKTSLNTVEEENKTDMAYINLPDMARDPSENGIDCHLPDYVNVETKGIELSVK